MIPLKLNIHNFLCYREDLPALDLSGVHVACLCGNNGHGKSALLDAITWALWGRARGRTQDDLISYGADEARVELEFLSRETRYRVARRRARPRTAGGQGASDLQLYLLQGETPPTLTGNTIRDTQARIDRLLGLDYTTFINSAFLMQGRADEFTRKTPAERKSVLATLLGLEEYDKLQARARQRAETGKAAAERAAGILEQLGRERDAIGDPSTELAAVNQQLQVLDSQLAQGRAELELTRNKAAGLARQREELAQLRERTRAVQEEVAQLEQRIVAGEERVGQYRTIVGQAAAIEEGAGQLRRARERFETLEASRHRFDELERQRRELEQAIAHKRTRLESHLDNLRRRVENELTPKAHAQPQLLQASEEAQAQVANLDRQEETLTGERGQLDGILAQIAQAKTLEERYKTEGFDTRKKLDLLQSSGEDAICPLCQTTLEAHGSHRLADNYQRQIEDLRRLYRENETRHKQLQSEHAKSQEQLTRRERTLNRERQSLQTRLSDLERQLSESKQAQQELEISRPQLDDGLAALESGAFAGEERQELGQIAQEIQALGYDDSQRQECYDDMRRLQEYETRHQQLTQAQELLPQEEAAVTQSRAMAERRRQDLLQDAQRLAAGEESLASLPDLEKQLETEEASVARLESERQQTVGRQGFLQGQLRRLDDLEQEMVTAQTRLESLEREQSICQELYAAFGRQGVQAMLIETMVPRLEEEANYLLGRMTDNRMHLKMETQRERRTGRGDPVETLEINVHDELGPRSYEMYSGGEAFRVNLSLRIALSKVLAQRMGAPLPTLFIDEGFGTQDAAGREQVLDVISSIQDDFEQIIVITHLDDLKDMFPVRIEVQKTDRGSTFWLS